MSKKLSYIVIAALVVCIAFTGFVGYKVLMPAQDPAVEEDAFDMHYDLGFNIGTNDKDQYIPLIPYEEARDIVNEILLDNGCESFMVTDGRSYWVDPAGEPTYENCMQYTVFGATPELMEKMAQEICVALNQTSVVITKTEVGSQFVDGVFE